ncbi:MAG TPA: D-alanyl-D-alanine carboxypeptidase/D-alanyl-D-alanine-endopeptidase [Terriglobales bacterium]|nr:D-alanyl-D-alanine carboxypeptidase/D-alanyl-D-alanine-endopeptidase [Terriglobales bacterium]
MSQPKRSLAFLLLFFLSIAAFAEDPPENKELAKKIDAILAQPEVARGFWGIEIDNLDTGKTIYSQNADRLFTPASNTKLFTTATTLALIGPDYRFHTTVETTGTLDKYGRLDGDLILIGRGDPNLSGRDLPYNLKTERTQSPTHVLEELADQIVARGVKVIDGDVIGDDTFFPYQRYGEGWSQDDLMWGDGAPASAITVNDNVLFLSVRPAAHPGERAFINLMPFSDYYKIDNRIMTTPAGTGPRRIALLREPGSNQILAWGNIPVDDINAHSEAIAIDDPAVFAAQELRQLLQARGVSIFGHPKARHADLASLSTFSVTAFATSAGGGDAQRPSTPASIVFATHESMPVIQDLRVINKVSQNLHAELMLRLLGKEKGTAGTIEAGLEVERGWLASLGITPDQYVFFDGSGLSRENLVSPHAVVTLLTYVSKQPWAKEYQDTLPVGGIDGTLMDRFRTPQLSGKVHAKTGSLNHVNSLSGFATTAKGEHIVFSILANNHMLADRKALETIDSIVSAVVEDSKTKKD